MVSRNNDREAQTALSRLLLQVVTSTLDDAEIPGVCLDRAARRPPDHRHRVRQDLPGYAINVRVRA